MNYSAKRGLFILSIIYTTSTLFPSMAIATTPEKAKKYECHGWHGYDKERNLFDKNVDAVSKEAAIALAGKDYKSDEPGHQVYVHRCDERDN
ncbi:hypothetical protein [Arsenophonus nasoniae]|uniref:DUF4189 domain-containing protein n=1 Tax=Arsenophonus nasoniae TaxID=638 RepID=A0AA95K1J9_9GAMM|nr:hypothetical protein [Arsenophonus nasoniae]WGL96749.1 hypothetical protein QE207_09565 [Arsenophonus nasoniae]